MTINNEENEKVYKYERFFRDPIKGNSVFKLYDESIAISNIKRALRNFGYELSDGPKYDKELKEAIREFQESRDHENVDEWFGPGTRRLLTKVLYQNYGDRAFNDLKKPEKIGSLEVFISYAWADSDIAFQFDQYLRDRNIKVKIDTGEFLPGQQIPESIRNAIIGVDKVLVFYSENSKNRDWPSFERRIAEEIGNGIWKVFYRDVFLGYFNENDIRVKQQSIRLSSNLV